MANTRIGGTAVSKYMDNVAGVSGQSTFGAIQGKLRRGPKLRIITGRLARSILGSRKTFAQNMGGAVEEDQYVLGPPPTSVYKSAWLDLGDAQAQKQVHYVTLWVKTEGSQDIKVDSYKDHMLKPVSSSSKFKLQPPDKSLKPTMGPTTFPTREQAVFDTSEWQRADFVPMRFPVAVQSAAWYAFEVSSDQDFTLVGWEIEFTARGTRVIQGHKA